MTDSSQNDNPPAGLLESVRFTSPGAEAMLRRRVGELCHPDPDRWQQVKHNASRTVYRGQIDGREVYLKHFHKRSLASRLMRRLGVSDAVGEFKISRRLADAGVSAVGVLAALSRPGRQWVLTESVTPGRPLDAWHSGDSAREPKALARMSRRLAKLLAAVHDAGVVHGDLHCGNVMVGPAGRLVLMDLHRATCKRRVSRRLRAMNLAQLCHDRTPMTTRSQRVRFLKQYLRFSGAGGTLRGWEMLVTFYAERHTRSQHAHLDRRIFRRNKYFTPVSLPDGWRGQVVLASKFSRECSPAAEMTFTPEQWRDALANVTALFDGPGVTVVKDRPSCMVICRDLAIGDRTVRVFMKRPHRRGMKMLLDCVCNRRSRSRRAFAFGHKLLARQFVTALPMAMLERRTGPVLWDSVLIAEAVEAPTACQYLTEALAPPGPGESRRGAWRRARRGRDVLWSLGRVVRGLHEAGFSHRDLKTVNILLHGARPVPVFIDLDGVSRPPVVTVRRRLRDLGRLIRALDADEPHASAPCRLRVLLGYLAPPGRWWCNFKILWREMARFARSKQSSGPRPGTGGAT